MASPRESAPCPAVAVTNGPRQHFFGYYEKTPWSQDGRRLLALEADVEDRLPAAEDAAVVGVIDLQNGSAFRPVAQTHAWNWQQGCMLQWLPTDPDRRVVYNDREGGRFAAVVLDILSGERRTLPRPVYALSHDGRSALTVDFSRLQACRPTTGYAGLPVPRDPAPCPDDDGVYRMDLETGESRLLLSFAQVAALRPDASMEGTPHWFEHLVWNPDDSRFLFLHRWQPPGEKRMRTRLFTVRPDGSDLFCVTDHGMVSHFDWKSPREILAWARRHGTGDRYYRFEDGTGKAEVVGEGVLTRDGHCSFSPDGRWLLTDTYPDAERMSDLILYRWADGGRFDIGRFFSPPHLTGHIRCDLHPRWSRRGDQVCIDSAHEGTRQVYVLDVGDIVGQA